MTISSQNRIQMTTPIWMSNNFHTKWITKVIWSWWKYKRMNSSTPSRCSNVRSTSLINSKVSKSFLPSTRVTKKNSESWDSNRMLQPNRRSWPELRRRVPEIHIKKSVTEFSKLKLCQLNMARESKPKRILTAKRSWKWLILDTASKWKLEKGSPGTTSWTSITYATISIHSNESKSQKTSMR